MTGDYVNSEAPKHKTWIGAMGLVLIVYLLLAYGAYSVFTSHIPSGNDFYPRWKGTRALLLEAKDPYSDEVTLEIQQGMYGRPAREDEDQVAFAYPLYVTLFIFPFAFFSYAQAQALWLSALVVLAVGAALLALQITDWKPSPVGLIAVSVWCLLFYPSARSIDLGQISIVVLTLVALALWAIRERRDLLAGSCLALATVKPQMAFLLIPFLLLWATAQRRRRVLGGFAASFAILLLVPSAVLPTWIPSFFASMSRYQSYTRLYREGRSPLGVLVDCLFPSTISSWVAVLTSVVLVGCLIYAWVRALRVHREVPRALILTIIVTLLVPAETGTSNQVLLLLPLVYWLSRWSKRRWLGISLSLILLLGPWLVFLSTVQGNLEHPIMALPLPVITLAMLWWAREETDGQLGLTRRQTPPEG